MEALTICSTLGLGLTEHAMDELIRMAQASEHLWVKIGDHEVLNVNTYDSIFAKPDGSFCGLDVHIDARFSAPLSRSCCLPSGCLIIDMADGSSKVT
jgi:homeobox-leucine zipper protein